MNQDQGTPVGGPDDRAAAMEGGRLFMASMAGLSLATIFTVIGTQLDSVLARYALALSVSALPFSSFYVLYATSRRRFDSSVVLRSTHVLGIFSSAGGFWALVAAFDGVAAFLLVFFTLTTALAYEAAERRWGRKQRLSGEQRA